MSYKFSIGQKVAFIGCEPWQRELAKKHGQHLPEAGEIVTIRGRRYHPKDGARCGTNGRAYTFVEYVNPERCISSDYAGPQELHIDEHYLRPLVDTSKHVEALKRLGNPMNWTPEDIARMTPVPARKKESAA